MPNREICHYINLIITLSIITFWFIIIGVVHRVVRDGRREGDRSRVRSGHKYGMVITMSRKTEETAEETEV